MKKISFLITAMAFVAIVTWVAISRKGAAVSATPVAQNEAAGNATKDKSADPNEAVSLNPVKVHSVADAIPLVDATNPSYKVSLALLERSFLSMLERESATKDMSPERLAVLSHQFAILRLSQTMFEATLAKVSQEKNGAIIAIPAYSKEGEQLRRQVFDQLLPDVIDESFRRRVTTQFGFFGSSSQQIEIKSEVTVVNGEEMYTIVHQYYDINGMGPLKGVSVLAARQLGPYAPFVGWLPKS